MPERVVQVTLRMEPPGPLARAWYRRLGMTPPELETRDPLPTALAKLVPYHRRSFHHAFAVAHGYFWLPCPLCGREFGGHEAGGTVPDPTRPPSGGMCICSQCTIERNRQASDA